MLSVIIPTVQKKIEVLKTLINLLQKDSSVDEIFIINNKPEVSLEFSGNKLNIYTPEANIYVNPAWNLGINKIKNENFVLLNDDLLVCEDFCKRVVNSEIFNDKKTGLIGVYPGSITQFSKADNIDVPENKINAEPEFLPLDRYLGTGDWGVAIFGKKQNYYEIPEDLKIIYGDNYLIYQNMKNHKQNYSVSNLPINHIHSSSSASPEFSKIVAEDILNSKKYFSADNSIPAADINSDFKIEYRGNVCIVNFTDGKTSLYFMYRNDKGMLPDKKITLQLCSLMPDNNMQLALKIINTIKSDQNRPC